MEAELASVGFASLIPWDKVEEPKRTELFYLECWHPSYAVFLPWVIEGAPFQEECPEVNKQSLHWKGSQWHVLTRPLVQFLARNETVRRVLFYLRSTFIPDERFLPLLIGQKLLPDSLAVINRTSHYKEWRTNISCKLLQKLHRELDDIVNNVRYFFYRKFVDHMTMLCADGLRSRALRQL